MHIPNVRVMNLDGLPDRDNDVFKLSGVTFDEVVPVTIEFREGTKIGTARPRIEDHALLVDLELTLLPPVLEFWPAIGGKVLEKLKGDDKWPNLIKSAHINEIGLCSTPNVDARIPKVIIPGSST